MMLASVNSRSVSHMHSMQMQNSVKKNWSADYVLKDNWLWVISKGSIKSVYPGLLTPSNETARYVC